MRRTMTVMRPNTPSWGSRLMLYGAVVLIAASGYALYIQVDTSLVWLNAIINTNRKMGIPVVEYLWTMLQSDARLRQFLSKSLFLLAMVIVSFVVMSVRKRTRACLVLLPVCALSFWAGCMLDLYSFDPGDLIRLLYASPLIVIAVGCILQLIHSHRLTHMRPQYQRPEPRRRHQRISPPPIKRSAPEPTRQYRDAPGATRMLPDATQPVVQQQPAQRKTLTQRLEKTIPDRADSHIGEPPATPAQQPRYQWKTIKKNDRSDVIGQ